MCDDYLNSTFVAGLIDEIVFEAQMQQLRETAEYSHDSTFINGLPNFSCTVQEHVKVNDSKMIRVRSLDAQNSQEVEFHNFPPGSAVALRSVRHHFLLFSSSAFV